MLSTVSKCTQTFENSAHHHGHFENPRFQILLQSQYKRKFTINIQSGYYRPLDLGKKDSFYPEVESSSPRMG